MIRASLLSLLLAGAAFAQNGPGGGPLSYAEGIVAEVEGTPITRRELELTCRLANPSVYRRLDPGKQLEIQHQQLDALIQERVLKLRAEEDKVALSKEDQARVESELAREADRYGGRERFRSLLLEEGLTLEFFRARLETNILTTRLLLKHISRDVFVTPGEVRLYYDQHRAEFETPSLLRVRRIDVFQQPISARDQRPALLDEALQLGPWDARAYIERLRQRILAGEPFEAVARAGSLGSESTLVQEFTRSDRPSASWPRPLGETAETLEVGQLSLVIESEQGALHLLLVEDRRPAGTKPLAEVQPEIEDKLKEAIWQRRVRDWIDQAQRRASVQKYLPPLPGAPQTPRGG